MLGPKKPVVRSEEYRRYVSGLACYVCKLEGYSQVAHADAGKGMGMKASDLSVFPACGPRLGEPGCHYRIGMTGFLGKFGRRELEEDACGWTRNELIRMSQSDPKLAALLIKLGVLPA